jgi:porphobilinogen synthase
VEGSDFKMKRLQRLRFSKNLRDLTSEIDFTQGQLIQPLFVVEDLARDEDIPGLADVKRHSKDTLLKQISKDLESGVRQFILFQVPSKKLDKGFSHKFSSDVISSIKKEFGPTATLWMDTCLCSLTTHGHCCVLHDNGNQNLEVTLKEISGLSKSYAEAGADGISPSDMNDGRVLKIREVLDSVSGGALEHIPIMSYSTKFSSHFYGPFRNAADSAPQFGDRTQYQIDVRNRTDAINSSLRCAEEGADLLMVKPGMTSIDLIKPIIEKTGLQVGAYQVSGEFAALTTLHEKGLLNFENALLETWHVFKRAGAQYIITYGARRAKSLGVK